jgi:hypothetical protein
MGHHAAAVEAQAAILAEQAPVSEVDELAALATTDSMTILPLVTYTVGNGYRLPVKASACTD